MRATRLTLTVVAFALAASGLQAAEGLQMADLAPAQTVGLVEVVNAAELRQGFLQSGFWDALQKTEAARQWYASEKFAESERRIEELLKRLDMGREEALSTYLGGRCALVLLPADEGKPYGVFLTKATNADAETLIKAVGGLEMERYRDVTIWEVQKDNQVDHMAFAGGVLMMTRPRGDELHQVLDVVVGGGASLGSEGHFAKAVADLPEDWRVRAFAAKTPPRQSPGAVAMYPQANGRVHFEWRIVSGAGDISISRPQTLTGPASLPDSAVAAVATVLHPGAIWKKAQQKMMEHADGEQRLNKAKMFVRGWFPGHSMESIVGAFGPEAAAAILKGEDGDAPGLLAMARLTTSGKPVAHAFKDGLAAKAMILGALGQKDKKPVIVNVREETYGNASLVIIEAPDALRRMLGDWADDIGLTIAVADKWIIAGTTPSGVKRAIDTAADGGATLAKAMTDAGEKVPSEPVTQWGVVRPAAGADIVLAWAEKLLGRERVEQAEKMTNLAELMHLMKRVLWQSTDEPEVIRGTADVQAVE